MFLFSTAASSAFLLLPFLPKDGCCSVRRAGLGITSYALSLLLTVLSFRAVFASDVSLHMITDRYFAYALAVHTLYAAGICCARLLICAKPKKGALGKRMRLVCTGVLLLCICMILEFFLFNVRHYIPALSGAKTRYFYANSLQVQGDYTGDERGNIVIGNNGATITVPEIGIPVYSVNIGVANELERHFDFKVGIYDDSHAYRPRESSAFLAHTQIRRSRNVAVYSHGSMQKLDVHFSASAKGLAVSFIALNVAPNFSFEPLRFLGLFAAAMSVILLRRYEWRLLRYDPRSNAHKRLTAVIAVLMALFGFFTVYTAWEQSARESGTAIDIAYVPGSFYDDAYHQMFDAYRSGQLNLKVDTDPLMAQLENPYDPSLRDSKGASYEWDRVYYNGKYYSYFGIAPLITVYAPYYALTGRLPTSATVSYIISLFFIAGAVLLYRLMLSYYRLRPPLLLYLAGLAALLLGSNVFWCLRQSTYYEVAAIYATTATVWWLYTMLRARISGKAGDFAISGAMVVLIAASRPNMLIYCALGIPLLLGFLSEKRMGIYKKAVCLGSFGIIVAAGAAAVMAYNYMRFNSVLEFGASLQLTVSDIRYNTPLNLYNVFPAIYHYLLQPPRLSFDFPYFERAGYPAVTLHNYYFRWATTGAVYYPLTWFCAGAFFKRKHEIPEKSTLRRMLPYIVLLCIYLTFSMGGAHYRYSTDFMFFLMLISVIELLRFSRRFIAGYKESGFRLLLFILLITSAICVLMTLSGENGAFLNKSPQLYLKLKYILEWFR